MLKLIYAICMPRKTARKSRHPLYKTVHPTTSLTIIFWILIGFLFLLLYLNGMI